MPDSMRNFTKREVPAVSSSVEWSRGMAEEDREVNASAMPPKAFYNCFPMLSLLGHTSSHPNLYISNQELDHKEG